MFGSKTQSEFAAALSAFIEAAQSVMDEHRAKFYPKAPRAELSVQWLQKRVRVVREGSVHCFVDFATGDILKSEGWSKPAKHARGNIYAEDHGKSAMGPYGAAYLR